MARRLGSGLALFLPGPAFVFPWFHMEVQSEATSKVEQQDAPFGSCDF
jgi:hypothetical protein